MTRALLTLAEVTVRFGPAEVLQGVSFDVPEDGVTALLGRSGAGKTTTLRAILSLAPARGSITLGGEEIGALPTHRVVQRGVGYVPEDREVFARLTVAENLRVAERPRLSPRYELVHELFPILAERAGQQAGTLSGGEQQMLALARALLNENRILLVDEPTKGLAPRVVADVRRVLERAADVATILLVEQNLAVARALAEHVVVLEDGAVAHCGSMGSLEADPALVGARLGVAAPAAGQTARR